ncbi:MAG: U32 family peptidase, partial [Desulfosarcinaceae bacterium]
PKTTAALWLEPQLLNGMYTSQLSQNWWWLPPVIWPDEEKDWEQVVRQLLQKGARRFVLNAPWQLALFKHPEKLNLWAGPFCNMTNPLAIRAFKLAGGHGVIVSPELGREDLTALPSKSVLPLGVVVSGLWPYCVSRILAETLKTNQPFTSPRGEQGWARRYGGLYWIFPNWALDLEFARDVLIKAGYRLLVHLEEPVPREISIKHRPGRWNWDVGMR